MIGQRAIQGGLISSGRLLLVLVVCGFARVSKERFAFGDVTRRVEVNEGEIYQEDLSTKSSDSEIPAEQNSNESSNSCRYFRSSKLLLCNGSIDFDYLKTLQNELIVDFVIEKYEAPSVYKKKYWSRTSLETGEWYTKLPKIYQKLTGEIQLKDTGLQINVIVRMIPRRDLKGFLVDGEAFSNKVIKLSWRLKGDVVLECSGNRTVISMNVGADAADSDWRLNSNLTFDSRNPENEADDWRAFGIITSDYVSENQFVLYQGNLWTKMTKGECKFSGTIKLHNVNLVGSVSGSVSPPQNRQITIPKSAFSNMTIKNIVFKDSNFYNDFDRNAFEGLNGVESISFVDSKLEVMPRLDELFQGFSNLQEINIEDCTTPSLKFGSLSTARNLQRLSFKGSGPLNLDDFSFMWLRNSSLIYLNLQHSHVKVSFKTKAVLWCVNNTLKHLDISHSTLTDEKDLAPMLNGLKIVTLAAEGLKLRKVPTNALNNVRRTLERLSLRGNDFRKNLEKYMFDSILNFPIMMNLRELNLMECHINYLEKGIFDNLPNLKILHVGYNNLENIQEGWTFVKPQVAYLDLTNNGLTPQVPSVRPMNLSRFKDLKTLDLSDGIFTDVDKLLAGLGSNLRNLSLRNMGLEDISEKAFENLTGLEVLDLSYNRNLRIIQSLSFRVLKNLKNLRILDLKHCRINGAAIFRDITFEIDSEDYVLENVEYIDLSSNNIKILDSKTFKAFPKLKFLNLSGNSITVWKMSLFLFNQYLETVFLDENKIETLTENMLLDIKKLKHVKLGNNPFICGSYVYDFIKVAESHKQQPMGGELFKFSNHVQPADWNALERNRLKEEAAEGKSFDFLGKLFGVPRENLGTGSGGLVKVLDWSESNYVCFSWSQVRFVPFAWVNEDFQSHANKKNDMKEVTLLWLPIVAFVGVVITVIIICWKFLDVHLITRAVRNAVALSFLSRGEKEAEKYEYNVFVSYSDKDRSWVLDNLLPRLESWSDVKVCLHERDFQVGLSIMENIIAGIDSSRNIVLVLSQAFLKSQWCQYEMHLAQHRLLERGRDQLILILLENIPPLKRPKTLKYLMMTKTYIEWPLNPKSKKEVDVFWNRLMKSLMGMC